MKPLAVLAAAGATMLALAALALASPGTPPGRRAGAQAFDPLFAPGASCTLARAGRARLLERNGWALRGLIEVYRRRGDAPALAAARRRFETTRLGEPGGPPLARL